MTGKILPINDELYCASCGGKGMKLTATKAESGRRRYICPSCGFRTTKALYTQPQILPETRVADIKKHKRFLVTSAVNDTPLVRGAHETFKRISDELDACYLIIPGVYKNPDLKHMGLDGMRWPEEIMPHLCNANVRLNKNLFIRGETRIHYTGINPLAGLNNAAGLESEIYGHPQVAMRMVPTAKKLLPKMLHTTGTISAANYGGSRHAQKAAFHHSLSALFVEIDGDSYWTTEVHYDGTGAYLFDRYYTPTESEKAVGAAGLVYGDTHVQALKPGINKLLQAMAKIFNPELQIFHDLHDHYAGSHHNDKNKLFQLTLKQPDIRKELMLSVKHLDEQRGKCVIVSSNHSEHLSQWFNRFRPERDPINIDLYYELGEMARLSGSGDLFRLFLERYCKKDLIFVGGNDLFEVAGVDCSQHGHRGPNGARGSAKAFARTGHKTVIGHSHTPAIEKGSYQVGTASMDMSYAVGYSSWHNTHCVIYPNGKRALHSIVNGKLSPIMRTLAK